MITPFMDWRGAVLKSGLPPITRHLLLTLGCHMNDLGESCFPSVSTLCDETGLCRQTVVRHLAAARDAGWIEVRKHGLAGQKWKRNEYRISWPHQAEGGLRDRSPQAEGGLSGNDKVVYHVDSNSPVNSPKTISTEQASIVDAAVQFTGTGFIVDDAIFDAWIDAFHRGRTRTDTEDWIESELAKASLWLQANPRKRKKNYFSFLNAWLQRAANPDYRRPRYAQAPARH